MAVFDDGSFVVTWTSKDQDGNGEGVFMRRVDSAGNAIDANDSLAAAGSEPAGITRQADKLRSPGSTTPHPARHTTPAQSARHTCNFTGFTGI